MRATQADSKTVDRGPTLQPFATYAQWQLQVVHGDMRQNFDIRRPEKVAEWKALVGRNSDEVYRLVMEEHKSPVYLAQ